MKVDVPAYENALHSISHDVIETVAVIAGGVSAAAFIHAVASGALGVGVELGIRMAMIDPEKAEAIRDHFATIAAAVAGRANNGANEAALEVLDAVSRHADA